MQPPFRLYLLFHGVFGNLNVVKERFCMKKISKEKMRYFAPVLVSAVLIVTLLFLPTGFEDAVIYQGAEHCRARVLETDNSAIIDTGLVRSGEQRCTLLFMEGKFEGQSAQGVNMMNGSLENDKFFEPGDTAMVVINYSDSEILSVTMIDHYRIAWEVVLAAIFVGFLVLFAGRTGIRAVLSFGVTILVIWKLLVPLYLNGANPIYTGLALTALMTFIIISLVYGFDRRFLSAITGCITGMIVTCVLGIIFTDLFKIHGAVMQYSESLLYSGYQYLNLTEIFMASIFIGSSGAVMDVAVDITSAVSEVVAKKPDISVREAIKSGFTVGRAVMGTITTTLLLAYSGGFIALIMVFMAQGTPIYAIFNYKYVAAEIVHTIVGSFGLVAVAPLTAVASGILLAKGGHLREVLNLQKK